MRVGIFYFSISAPVTPDEATTPITLPGGGIGWIRVEEVDSNPMDALSLADPREDEAVMNTHPLESVE